MKVTVVSEIGINWFGDMKLAKEMIDLSKESGADIVKFQMYRPKELLGENSPYLKDAERGVLNKEQAKELKEYSDNKDIEWCTSVFHPDLVEFTEELGMKRYKIASRSVIELDLLKEINKTKKPVIMSVGLSDDSEIYKALDCLRDAPSVVLLYCVSNYPADIRDINLNKLSILLTKFKRRVGFSSHCPKISPSLAAIALGADTIENHVVKSKSMRGCDVRSSLTFKEFSSLVKYTRELEKIIP